MRKKTMMKKKKVEKKIEKIDLYNKVVNKNTDTGEVLMDLEFTRNALFREDNVPLENCLEYLAHCICEIKQLDKASTDNARDTGAILLNVKRILKPGMFSEWVEENLPFSHKEANNLMNLYRVTLNHPQLLLLKKSVIYMLASPTFTEDVLSLIEDSVGCFNISLKEVVVLRTALINGDITPDAIVLNDYFKKRDDIDAGARIQAADDKIVRGLEREQKVYARFLVRQAEVAGKNFENRYTVNSKYVTEVVNDAISAIRRGPGSAVAEPILIDHQPLQPLESHSQASDSPQATQPIEPVENRLRFSKPSACRVVQEIDLAPYDFYKNEEAIPDETIICLQRVAASREPGPCYLHGDESIPDETLANLIDINIGDALGDYWNQREIDRFYKGILCADDFLPCYSEATPKDIAGYYEDILCPDDYLKSNEAGA